MTLTYDSRKKVAKELSTDVRISQDPLSFTNTLLNRFHTITFQRDFSITENNKQVGKSISAKG